MQILEKTEKSKLSEELARLQRLTETGNKTYNQLIHLLRQMKNCQYIGPISSKSALKSHR